MQEEQICVQVGSELPACQCKVLPGMRLVRECLDVLHHQLHPFTALQCYSSFPAGRTKQLQTRLKEVS